MQYTAESCFQNRVMAAPDRILVATDLTDSDYLLPHVIAQAEASCAQVTLFHAIRPTDSLPFEAGAIRYIDEDKIDRDARLSLLSMAREIQSRGIICEISIRHGYPADAIRAEIDRTGASRVIMATHGRRKLAKIALGSVASELLGSVDIPIFAIGPAGHGATQHATPRRILHPVSLAGDYRRSVCLALDLAQTHHAELTLLHVLEPNERGQFSTERSVAWTDGQLSALIPPEKDLRLATRTRVAKGNVIEEVLRAAAAISADWIVLGIDGVHPFWKFRDSAAYRVLARADCPVLTLRHEPCHATIARDEVTRIAGIIA